LFNNNKRFYVKKYFYGYIAGLTNNNTFKYLKNSLNHTCFYAKDVKGVYQKGNISTGTEVQTRSNISNTKLPEELKNQNITKK
jgi:hypothetical protein